MKTPETIISSVISDTFPDSKRAPAGLVCRIMEGLYDGGYEIHSMPAAEPSYAANDDICSAARMAVIQGVVSKTMARARQFNDAAEMLLDALECLASAQSQQTKIVTFPLPAGQNAATSPEEAFVNGAAGAIREAFEDIRRCFKPGSNYTLTAKDGEVLCNTPIEANGFPHGTVPVASREGIVITIGYSRNGWGHRQDACSLSDEICTPCFNDVMDLAGPVAKLIEERRRAVRDGKPIVRTAEKGAARPAITCNS